MLHCPIIWYIWKILKMTLDKLMTMAIKMGFSVDIDKKLYNIDSSEDISITFLYHFLSMVIS